MLNLSTNALRERYEAIMPVIQTLAAAWRDPANTAEILLTSKFKIDDNVVKEFDIAIDLVNEVELDTLRDFIHNLCTKLCAEKLEIECELIDRNEPIFTTR